MLEYQDKIFHLNTKHIGQKTYINCDIRFFNFDFLIEKIGFFDVILMDPPWRIKGGQQNDTSFMFSNSKFSLEYNTLSNQEIINLKIQKLSQKGLLFLWILNTQINVASKIMQQWGYNLIDQLIWVKLKNGKVHMTHGYYFMHSFEICLVGAKCPPGESLDFFKGISNNILFSEVRDKSQKPDELYEIIDLVMPGSKKIEIFARNNNLRPGWFSIGNQLGEVYDKWYNLINCNKCQQIIKIGVKRYKSRLYENYDICETCFEYLEGNISEFFKIDNSVTEKVLHNYHQCNMCGIEPIWGIRFTCETCIDYDLCEACFDENFNKKFHSMDHHFQALELSLLADGLPAHESCKCVGCFQNPIIGVRFTCNVCNNFNLCQNCFFTKPMGQFRNIRGHNQEHPMEIKLEPIKDQSLSQTKCAWCLIDPIEGDVFKCENCYSFLLCANCHSMKQEFKTNMATTHKPYHKFKQIFKNE